MSLIVQKYGGTSVGSPERIQAVAGRIARSYGEGHRLTVVVSAMGQTTDELIDLAHRVSKSPPHREMDMLLTAGERISMALLSMALADHGIAAVSFTGSQTGIITDENHRRARIKQIHGDRVRSALASGKVAIVAGFQGVSESKEITTLGRGGSDTTAAALAAVLKADACEIYTDVDGVYSADPRLGIPCRLWRTLPHDLMIEMATRGAGVLHPRSVELAFQYGVALKVKNSLNESEGTMITTRDQARGFEEFGITGVAADRGKVLVTVELMRPTVLGAIWDRATQSHLAILAPVFTSGRVQFFGERDAQSEWTKNFEDLAYQGFIKSYKIEPEMVPVSVVGYRFSQDGAALSQVLDVLARNHILVETGSASPLAITVAVPVQSADDGIRALHQEFFSGGTK